MKPLDPDLEFLIREWIEKADADLEVARRVAAAAPEDRRLREIAGFHCQQAAEKYLKALLTSYQIEFPKTHDIKELLQLAERVGKGRGGFSSWGCVVDSIRRRSPLSGRYRRDAARR